ncbi:hypothetical protein [Variovorax sp. YR634]|nr:hypothetical protein [Variovorax sp. YR634]
MTKEEQADSDSEPIRTIVSKVDATGIACALGSDYFKRTPPG